MNISCILSLTSYLFRIRFPVMISMVIWLQEPAIAQEMLGTTTGNYAGVNSTQINPSALHNSKMYLDVQLAGLDMFVENNALYIERSEYRFLNFFNSGYQWPLHIEYGQEERTLYLFQNERNKTGFVNTRLNGPGAMFIWNHHAFALTTGVRSVSSLHNVPYDIVNFSYIGLGYHPQHNINYTDNIPFTLSAMAWGEIGISYAYTFYARGFDQWSAGISVKRLLGIGGMYLHSNQLDYVVHDDSTLNVYNLDAEAGVALPIDYNTNEVNSQPLFKGGGFGFDFGLTYQRLSRYHQDYSGRSLCGKPYEDYLYRIGVSLIDIGGIRFNDNAVKMRIDNRSSYWQYLDHIDFKNIDQLLDTISYKFYGDTVSAYTGDQFILWLPSAVSVQFDYHFRKSWYVNANLIWGFPMAHGALARPAEFSLAPRYETRNFEASMPVSVYDWSKVRVGLALRIYGLTIGTEKLGAFFPIRDFTGLDFYFSIKWFLDKGRCRAERDEKYCAGVR